MVMLQYFLDYHYSLPTKGMQGLGVVLRMGALGVSLALHNKRMIRRHRVLCRTAYARLDDRVPNNRLHISGEYYVH